MNTIFINGVAVRKCSLKHASTSSHVIMGAIINCRLLCVIEI